MKPLQNEIKGLLFEALSIIRDQRMTFLQVQAAMSQDSSSMIGVDVRKIVFEPGWHKLSDELILTGQGTINVLETDENKVLIYQKYTKGTIGRELYLRDSVETITISYGSLKNKRSGKILAASDTMIVHPLEIHQFEALEDTGFFQTIVFISTEEEMKSLSLQHQDQ